MKVKNFRYTMRIVDEVRGLYQQSYIADSFRQMTVLREEQQRSASSWGWPEECRYRGPVSAPASRQLAGVCNVYVRCVLLLLFVTYVREPDHKAGVSLF